MKTPNRGGRPKREPKPGERVQLSFRVTPETKAKLDDAAAASGRSQSQEAEIRLDQTFADESAFGGPEIANMARLMAAAFLRGGQRGAYSRNRSNWSPAQWLNDPFCYDVARKAVDDALATAQPAKFEPNNPDPKQRQETAEFYSDAVLSVARGGPLKVTFEGEEPDNG